jgi:hypothetical protein
MKLRFKDKTKHPMYGKKYDSFALSKISKPGKFNPMFGVGVVGLKHSHSIKF